MTYRRNFTPIRVPNQYTSDSGWGCMLRSKNQQSILIIITKGGQMILAEALHRHVMGDQWCYPSDAARNEAHARILAHFADHAGMC